MFAKAYFENATKCFSQWMDLIQRDPRMASDYHSRGCELVATYARITGEAESRVKSKAIARAVYM